MSLDGNALNLRGLQDIWTDTPGEYLGTWPGFKESTVKLSQRSQCGSHYPGEG